MGVYLDASVLVSIFVADQHSDRVLQWLSGRSAITLSAWTVAEFSSALSFRVRSDRATAQERASWEAELDAWLRTQPSPLAVDALDFSTCRALMRRQVSLRTPDALHLAIALNRRLELATFDQTLKAAAQSEGVVVSDL